jgi:hypothetical protein
LTSLKSLQLTCRQIYNDVVKGALFYKNTTFKFADLSHIIHYLTISNICSPLAVFEQKCISTVHLRVDVMGRGFITIPENDEILPLNEVRVFKRLPGLETLRLTFCIGTPSLHGNTEWTRMVPWKYTPQNLEKELRDCTSFGKHIKGLKTIRFDVDISLAIRWHEMAQEDKAERQHLLVFNNSALEEEIGKRAIGPKSSEQTEG